MTRTIRTGLTAAAGAFAAFAGAVQGQTWEGWRPRQPVDNTAAFAPRLLDAHNAERRRLGLAPLRWDPALAEHARQWAEALARRGAFEHSPPNARPGEGENLFTGTGGAYSLEEMIGLFINERADFKAGVFPAVSRSGRWEAVGHYTQIVWRGTTAVGCAVASRGGRDWLVCRYSPPGNVVGQQVP